MTDLDWQIWPVSPFAPRTKIHPNILVAKHFEHYKAIGSAVTALAVCDHHTVLWNTRVYLPKLFIVLEGILFQIIVPVDIECGRNMTCSCSSHYGAVVFTL